jgi:asparagine synthase (glutamine-hydrolysing)
MSGIAGIWNPDGQPPPTPLAAAMAGTLAHRGLDEQKVASMGAAVFAIQSTKIVPQEMQEHQPAQQGELLVMLDGRLDDREDLIAALGTPHGVSLESSDTTLLLTAYRRWGADFLQHLKGDFALALFDHRNQQLYLARDVMGAATLYYTMVGKTLYFATEIKALLVIPQLSTGPDQRSLAEWLFQLPDYSDETNTFFEGIKRIPPGMVLTASSNGTALRRYWDFDISRRLHFSKHEDYVAAYRECFIKAVKNRMRSSYPIAITVSGGLDSSSIYSVAESLRGSGIGDFFGVALVGDHPTTNELSYQQAIEDKYGITLDKVYFSTTEAMGCPGKDVWHCEGPFLKWDIWRDLFRQSRQRGARVLLSGFFGDQLLQNPQYILDLAGRMRWLTAYRHIRQYFHWWEGETTRDLAHDLFKGLKGYLVPESLRPLYHRWRSRFKGATIEELPWYSESFTHMAADLESNAQPMDVAPGRAHAKILYRHARSKIAGLRLELEVKSDAMMQTTVGYPFRDRDLIALLMALPGEVVYQAGYRGIHVEAMRGLLPESIRTRHTKAAFHEPARLGARNDLMGMRENLLEGTASHLGFFKPPAALVEELEVLEQALAEGRTGRATWLAIDVMGMEQWLTTFFGDKSHKIEL